MNIKYCQTLQNHTPATLERYKEGQRNDSAACAVPTCLLRGSAWSFPRGTRPSPPTGSSSGRSSLCHRSRPTSRAHCLRRCGCTPKDNRTWLLSIEEEKTYHEPKTSWAWQKVPTLRSFFPLVWFLWVSQAATRVRLAHVSTGTLSTFICNNRFH